MSRSESTPPTPVTAAGQLLMSSSTMLLVAAGRTAQRRLDTALAEHGLTLRHLGALGHLARNPELSYSDLARRVDVTVQSMHATIAALVDLDAVLVETAERGRPARLRLTDHGHELLLACAASVARLDGTWNPAEFDSAALRAALLDAIHRLRAHDETFG